MAELSVKGVIALRLEADAVVTNANGKTWTQPAMEPFMVPGTTVDIAGGTTVHIMRSAKAPHGKILQVFSVDDVVTV